MCEACMYLGEFDLSIQIALLLLVTSRYLHIVHLQGLMQCSRSCEIPALICLQVKVLGALRTGGYTPQSAASSHIDRAICMFHYQWGCGLYTPVLGMGWDLIIVCLMTLYLMELTGSHALNISQKKVQNKLLRSGEQILAVFFFA